MWTRVTITAIVVGAFLALLTGLFSNTPPLIVGATHYGYPLPWLSRLIIAPQYFPWQVNVVNLIGDILFWSIVVGLILLILRRARKPRVGGWGRSPFVLHVSNEPLLSESYFNLSSTIRLS
jgi:hypothetical protein